MTDFEPHGFPPSQDLSAPGLVLDFHAIIRVLREKSWLIISCVVLAVVAAGIYVVFAPRVYRAATTIEVEQEDAKVVTAEQVVSGDMHGLEILNTVADKLCNPASLQQVLEANHLLPPEDVFGTNESQMLAREKTIKKFARDVNVSLIRNTRLIDITVRNTDPRLAARLANSLVDNYLAQDALAQQTTIERANTFLRQEADRQNKNLEASEQALEDYRKQVGAISLEQNQDIITPRLKELSDLLTQTNAEVIQARGAYQDSLKIGTNIEDLLAYPRVATDPEVAQISTDVAQHENDFVLIRQQYRERNPKYIVAAASLAALRQQLAETALKVRNRMQESLRIAYQNALTSQEGLEAELNATETNAMRLSDVAIRFNVRSLELDSDKEQYNSIISRLDQTAVAAQITPERLRVIQSAVVPALPASPKVALVFTLASLGGLLVGLGISFVLNYANTSIRTVEESELYLALPVLGLIPRLPKAEVDNNKLAANGDRNSAGAEIFRTLRTTLSLLGCEKDRKSYLFTSTLPDEGKTFASMNYAASLAQQGLRTLLVDMDLRRPMIEELLTGKRSPLPGVTDYFLGHKKFDEICLQHKDMPKLFWIPAGSSVPSPLELLSQSDFQQLVNEGVAHYDRIVIDTPPVLPVSDALMLAAKVQTVVLVVRGGKTPRKAVQRSVQLLNQANAPIGGIVLNLLPGFLLDGYYYSPDYK